MTFCGPLPTARPLTLAEATRVMQMWKMLGGFAGYATNGAMQLTQVRDTFLEMSAASLVLTGYGLKLAHGIELNATGLALWNEVTHA